MQRSERALHAVDWEGVCMSVRANSASPPPPFFPREVWWAALFNVFAPPAFVLCSNWLRKGWRFPKWTSSCQESWIWKYVFLTLFFSVFHKSKGWVSSSAGISRPCCPDSSLWGLREAPPLFLFSWLRCVWCVCGGSGGDTAEAWLKATRLTVTTLSLSWPLQ